MPLMDTKSVAKVKALSEADRRGFYPNIKVVLNDRLYIQ